MKKLLALLLALCLVAGLMAGCAPRAEEQAPAEGEELKDIGKIRIAYYYDDQTTRDVMDLVVQNLADAGIEAEASLLSGDLGTLIYADRNYDMLYCGEAADDPGQMYFYLLGVGGYFDDIICDKDTRSELFNTLIDQYNATTDFNEQKDIAFALQQNGLDLCAIAPVVTINKLALYNSANITLPEDAFAIDWSTRDWRFEDWALSGEAEAINLMWTAQKGTDSIFESPWCDLQCLYPYMVFDSLCSYEADGTVVPKLMSEYAVSEDGLTYTFTLREGVKWSDGQDFTAEDVAFSFWGALADPLGSYKSGLSYITGAVDVTDNAAETLSGVAVDGNTVTITLDKPYGLFMSAVAKTYILPQHLLGEVAAEELSTYEDFWKKPVGTGAYVIDEVSFPDYCTLVRNDNFWGEAAGIEKAVLKSYATGGSDAAFNALASGELDFAYGNEMNDIGSATATSELNADIKVLQMTSNYQRQFLFNCVTAADGNLNPSMQDTAVRQAINMLIDKEAIAAIYGANAAPLTTHLNPNSAMYNTEIPAFARDVEGAQKLLSDAGYKVAMG